MTGEVTAYVAIGSNLGDRHAITASAIEMVDDLPECLVLAQSTLRETAPVGPVEQPAYLNGAIAIRTALLPRELLDRLLTIERAHGRDRQTERR